MAGREGLKLMKWLTDHVCVRGINRLIPMPFPPKEKDEDCPPHFYARGRTRSGIIFSVVRLCKPALHPSVGRTAYNGCSRIVSCRGGMGEEYEPFETAVKSTGRSTD